MRHLTTHCRTLLTVLMLGLIAATAGCGQRGPLRLPDPPAAAKAAKPDAPADRNSGSQASGR